ncbi:MAG TPA: histidinol-phosphatase HisJ family protein [Thermoanaerobaculaceae bacterium]|nr:histidinol-phosphatase HisJ family protein [Thermoanaerobaculaceae bacterium]HPS77988.1 histidinol-phosphatase HisJ family protein [Thermoanaerobaculaceae bacterium]
MDRADVSLADNHTHTARCGHAEGETVDYVEAALAAGLSAIAVTDHVPMFWLPEDQRDPHLAMALDDLPRYVDEVLALGDQYRDRIDVRLGIEADFIPGHEEGLRRLLEPFPFDLVLGSVHWVDGWLMDGPRSIPRFQQGPDEVDRIWKAYAETLIRAARSGLFDILTHLDLPKKFGFRPSVPFAGRQADVVTAVAASGCAVELSSGGLRKPVGEAYPAPDLLRDLVAAGVPVVLSSDAHAPAEVGFRFDDLRDLLASARAASQSRHCL